LERLLIFAKIDQGFHHGGFLLFAERLVASMTLTLSLCAEDDRIGNYSRR
jgi:hypothetical protein